MGTELRNTVLHKVQNLPRLYLGFYDAQVWWGAVNVYFSHLNVAFLL